MFFKKKKEALFSPIKGTVKDLSEVADPVFSQKLMGDGFAVSPVDGYVYAPVEGRITSVFPTKHAVGIQSNHGLEVLIHLGIDTVELKGEAFEVFVKEGQKVTPETKIAEMNLSFLAEQNKDTDSMVIITNMDQVKSIDKKITNDQNRETSILTVVCK